MIARAPQAAMKAPMSAMKAPTRVPKVPQSATKAPQTATKAPQAATKAPQAAAKAPQATKAPAPVSKNTSRSREGGEEEITDEMMRDAYDGYLQVTSRCSRVLSCYGRWLTDTLRPS